MDLYAWGMSYFKEKNNSVTRRVSMYIVRMPGQKVNSKFYSVIRKSIQFCSANSRLERERIRFVVHDKSV